MKPIFTNKEEYLLWRKMWRARYAEITKDIRDLKLACRASESGIGRDKWTSRREHIVATIKRFTDPKTGYFQSQRLTRLQEEASYMMEWRKESKSLAQEQYLKAHPPSSVPS